ncbi:MAG: hypothetical protein NVSMB29_17520 [Candidatus Dormibacteria bacterium]
MSAVGWGVLSAASIADQAMLPAINAAANARLVAIAARDRDRAETLAVRHRIDHVHNDYAAVLDDQRVTAVYIPLVNSDHRPWTLRALAAGKHVLCEKPLAMHAAEAREMAAAARSAGLLLMEAFMYRFHPRMRELRSSVREPRFVHAAFGFHLESPGNYRWRPGLGGGALLDVGCYTIDVVRWLLGEPVAVRSVVTGHPVDTRVAAVMEFAGGAQAALWASFEAPEHQELVVVDAQGSRRVTEPFTAWRDPHDPYRIMIEEFGDAILHRTAPPRSLEDSIATAELIDQVRAAGAV